MPKKAAGLLILAPDGRILFLKRSDTSDHAGEWCFVGGGIEGKETPEQAAMREAEEEIGGVPDGVLAEELLTLELNGVEFTTFVVRVKDAFEPVLNEEHTAFEWAKPADAPQPLHPGCVVALKKFEATELGVAEMIAQRELPSPQKLGNFWLFDLRITGTGVAHRKARNEWVYRRPQDYLTEEFLRRCGGLPVIVEHPEDLVLDSDEFNARVVGTMLHPYILGDEVWGVAKIFDEATAEMMNTQKLSTSPGVVLAAAGDDKRIGMSDGSSLLIEGKPSLLDHLAICELGVWDKGGEPTGVRSQHEDRDMPEDDEKKLADEAKAKADAEENERLKKEEDEKKAKADAEANGKLDKVLGMMDSLCSRMDAMEAKGRGEVGEDITEEGAEELENEAIGALETAQEMEAKPEALAADTARAHRLADSARKRADSAHRIIKKRKAEAQARADAQELTEFRAGILKDVDEKLGVVASTIPKALTDADRSALANAQARCDAVASAFGEEAPRALQGETLLDYRKRLAGLYKKHSPAWKGIDIGAIADSAMLELAEGQIFDAAAKAARNPVDIPEDTLREVSRRDPITGRITQEFYGRSPRVWMQQFMGARSRVTEISARKDH